VENIDIRILDLFDLIIEACIEDCLLANRDVVSKSLGSWAMSDEEVRNRVSQTASGIIISGDLEDRIPELKSEPTDEELISICARTYRRIMILQAVYRVIEESKDFKGCPVEFTEPVFLIRPSVSFSNAKSFSSYFIAHEVALKHMKVNNSPDPWVLLPFADAKEIFYFKGSEGELKASIQIILDEDVRDILRDGKTVSLGGASYHFMPVRGWKLISEGIYSFAGCYLGPEYSTCQTDEEMFIRHGFIFMDRQVIYIMDCGGKTSFEYLLKV
jgi:hypothetical protein